MIYRVLFLGQAIKEAVDSRRLHHQLYPNQVILSSFFNIPLKIPFIIYSTTLNLIIEPGFIRVRYDPLVGGRTSGELKKNERQKFTKSVPHSGFT